MASSTKFKVEGLSECLAALKELPKATGKNVLKRTLVKAAEPIVNDAKSMGTYKDRTGELRKSISIGTKLTRGQGSDILKSPKRVEVFVGPQQHGRILRYAHLVEFGTYIARPFPFMRPAWEANKMGALSTVKDLLWQEIQKAAERIARKAARQAAAK